jgi:NADH-quinone oxidoreductase subunit N
MTSLYELQTYFTDFSPAAIGITFLVLAGLAFKVSLFPFHFWAPDVYQGAPTPVAGFLSTASKAAGFAVLIRLFTAVFPGVNADWSLILAILATLTMTVGNLIALAQKNIKRMLAYSSIAHAGYAMIGVVAFSPLGMSSTVFYLLAYLITNLLAFAIVNIIGKATGGEEAEAFNGLSRRNATLGLAALVAFLSLSGMPPFAGFVAKVFVFAAAVESGWTWLAVVGVINSIIGLYYYLNVLKVVYLYRMPEEDEARHPVQVSKTTALALAVLAIGILLVGTVFGPWFGLSSQAAAALF